MPDITRVTGPWTDGDILTAEQLSKDTYQGGREAGFDGAAGGGSEIINGQLDLDGNFGGSVDLTRRNVRRGTFTLPVVVRGFRQSRDIWYKTFPDLNHLTTPDIYERARAVAGASFETRNVCTAFYIDVSIDYTVASNQNLRELISGSIADVANPPFRAFCGIWLENELYKPSATPLMAGRSSTVEPPRVDATQYFNQGSAPDFRRFAMKFRISAADLLNYDPALALFLSAGWHNISFRVSGRQTIRVHGGAVIITPIV